jgi:methyl-accepting chemotaxis protein
MTAPDLPSVRRFRLRHSFANGLPGTLAALFVGVYLSALLQLDPASRQAFALSVVIAFVVLTPIGQWMERRSQRGVVQALAANAAGHLDPATVRIGYRAALRLPLGGLLWQMVCWPLAGVIVTGTLRLRLGELDGFRTLVVVCGCVSGGAIVLPFAYYTLRALVRPVRQNLAARLPLEEQADLSLVVPLRWKLVLPTAAVCVATSVFAALFSYAAARAPVEAHDLEVKGAYLGYAATALASGEQNMESLTRLARDFHVADSLLRIDPAGAKASALTLRERSYLTQSGAAKGDSRGFESAHSFAWQRLEPSGALLVAITPLDQLTNVAAATKRLDLVFGAALLIVLGTSLAVVGLLVRDVAGTTERLNAELERVRDGDLRPGVPIGIDDELARLGRAFGDMTAALRHTLQRAAKAADRVDEAATQVSEVSASIGSASAGQVAGLEKAAASTAAINRQVSGITASSEALTRSVEEASSSVLELGAAAEELHQTSQALNGQVDDVSTSIEQMVRNVGHVNDSTRVLAEAVIETSASLSQMGQSMEAVDGHAVETARLSGQVLKLAESGRQRMRRSSEGMESIRTATEDARNVIQGLSGRVAAIGKVVDVIDDVADETNLLALNAAIIAAQAGDQGRAFSVVADEIKDLADRVLSSTKEIALLIGSVQDESARAAQAIELGTTRVRDGVELSAGVGVALEEITEAARNCGQRTQDIVSAVREHAGVTAHAGRLMERVNGRVDEIRVAASEQASAHQVVLRSAAVMRDVAHQTQRTAEEQASGAARIRDGMEVVCDVVDRIHAALREQSGACRNAVTFLEQIHERTLSHDESAQRLQDATRTLQRQAASLRTDLQRFKIHERDARAEGA